MQSLLERYANEIVAPNGAFCTGFVLFAEYLDADNQFYTFTLKDPNAPLWRLQGLVDFLREQELTVDAEEGEE
jgi:hypothetical protein